MNNIDFKKLVNDMREAQKCYFKSRQWKDLEKAKAAEKAVDDFLAKYYRKESEKTLFDK